MKNLHINTEFLQGAVQMELNGLGENRVKSVEVTIINERQARIFFTWQLEGVDQHNSFLVTNMNTFSGLRTIISTELADIEREIKIFYANLPTRVQSDPTTEKD